MASAEPPVIDFGPFYGTDVAAQARLAAQLHEACQEYGFFQIVNHGVSSELQTAILKQSEDFFSLPLEVKEIYDKDKGGFNRGYERLRAQNFEKGPQGDLKEGYYFGIDLPLDHPYVVGKRMNLGPNTYPKDVSDPALFKDTIDQYHKALTKLTGDILQVLLTGNLKMTESMLNQFCDTPIATLRLLHYPPQEPDASALERGIGAHTDFGAITVLFQDQVGGLQVWGRHTSEWIDVVPIPGAFVVNAGNMMMRWTNDKYLSNLHRVINKSGKERYSIPFFFSGNPDFIVKCLPSCEDEKLGAKYAPISVDNWMRGRYADTYGSSKEKAMAELSVEAVTAAAA